MKDILHNSMKEIQVVPQGLNPNIASYFRTTTEGTILSTMGVGPCIACVYYRIGYIGLAHNNRCFDSIIRDISTTVKPEMEKHGSGDISCMLFTGQSLMMDKNFEGKEGIDRYLGYTQKIEELGIKFNEEDSKTYILTNHNIIYYIEKIEVYLVGDNYDVLKVKIQYIPTDLNKSERKDHVEEFEIDMNTHEKKEIITSEVSVEDFAAIFGITGLEK